MKACRMSDDWAIAFSRVRFSKATAIREDDSVLAANQNERPLSSFVHGSKGEESHPGIEFRDALRDGVSS
jgi:hypothetical protein